MKNYDFPKKSHFPESLRFNKIAPDRTTAPRTMNPVAATSPVLGRTFLRLLPLPSPVPSVVEDDGVGGGVGVVVEDVVGSSLVVVVVVVSPVVVEVVVSSLVVVVVEDVVGSSVVVVVVVSPVVVEVVVGSSVVVVVEVVVVVVVVVVVSSFGFTIVLVTEWSAPKSSALTSVSADLIVYPVGASVSVKIYLSFNKELTVMFPFSSVTYSPITWLFAWRMTLNFAP